MYKMLSETVKILLMIRFPTQLSAATLANYWRSTKTKPGPDLQDFIKMLKFGRSMESLQQSVVLFESNVKSFFDAHKEVIRLAGGIRGVLIHCEKVVMLVAMLSLFKDFSLFLCKAF